MRSPSFLAWCCCIPPICRPPSRGARDSAAIVEAGETLKLSGTYPTSEGKQSYNVTGVPVGYGLMYVAGVLSGLLGIGSGAVKVLAMDQAMKIPSKSPPPQQLYDWRDCCSQRGTLLEPGIHLARHHHAGDAGRAGGSMIGAKVLVKAKLRCCATCSRGHLGAGVEMIVNGVKGRL